MKNEIKADIFSASGVIQYLENPKEVLEKVTANKNFHYVYINRMPLLERGKQFCSIQQANLAKFNKNAPNKTHKFINTFLPWTTLREILTDNGYKIIMTVKEPERLSTPGLWVDFYSILAKLDERT